MNFEKKQLPSVSPRLHFEGEAAFKAAQMSKKQSFLNPNIKDETMARVAYNSRHTNDTCSEASCSDMTSSNDSTTSRTLYADSPTSAYEGKVYNEAFVRQHSKIGSITRKEILMELDELKFAKTVKICSENSTLLEEETSPTDSLVSSDSGDTSIKKQVSSKATFEDIEEIDLEDTSNPDLVNLISPETPGTPTHVTNSLSFSDDGNKDEFLIDDEICDQPQLVFNSKHNNSESASIYSPEKLISKNVHTHSRESMVSQCKSKPQMPSPSRNILRRSESYNTLSLHDSISSDDLMGDFEGSLDSIDRQVML